MSKREERYKEIDEMIDTLEDGDEKKFALWLLLRDYVHNVEIKLKKFPECKTKEDFAVLYLMQEEVRYGNMINESIACDLW